MRVGMGGRRLLATVAALTIGVGLVACGDDDEEGTSEATSETAAAPVEEVSVEAVEYDFTLSATPTAETKSVTFDNQGEDPHAMIFARINEGFTLDEAYELEGRKGSAELLAEVEAKPGESQTVELGGPVEPGSYAVLCPIGGPEGLHYKLGQLEEFDIE